MQATRVLVVDDDPCQRERISESLRNRGYEVVTAGDGSEALERAAATPPSVIILDLEMPVMDGRAFLGAAHADVTLRDTPVIAITSGSEQSQATLTLFRPLRMDSLLALVEWMADDDARAICA